MNEKDGGKIKVDTHEVAIIRKAFKGNERILKSIRAIMLGLSPTPAERAEVAALFSDEELVAVVSNRFYPIMSKDSPIGQVNDTWLGVESMVFGANKETIYQAMQYKDKALAMTRDALIALKDPTAPCPDVRFTINPTDEYAVALLARNQYVRHVEQQLLFLWVIAEQNAINESELAARNAKNSAK